MFIPLGLSITVGVLDGLGIAMFLPLLQMVSEDGMSNPDDLGYMTLIVDIYNAIGIDFNLAVVLTTMVFFFVLKGIATSIKAAYNV